MQPLLRALLPSATESISSLFERLDAKAVSTTPTAFSAYAVCSDPKIQKKILLWELKLLKACLDVI